MLLQVVALVWGGVNLGGVAWRLGSAVGGAVEVAVVGRF